MWIWGITDQYHLERLVVKFGAEFLTAHVLFFIIPLLFSIIAQWHWMDDRSRHDSVMLALTTDTSDSCLVPYGWMLSLLSTCEHYVHHRSRSCFYIKIKWMMTIVIYFFLKKLSSNAKTFWKVDSCVIWFDNMTLAWPGSERSFGWSFFFYFWPKYSIDWP